MVTAESRPRDRFSVLLASSAAGLFCYFVAALLLLHVLRPDYTVVDHMISDYAVGRFGWMMIWLISTSLWLRRAALSRS